MSTADRVILVIDERTDRASALKEMIEFMDAPEVRVTNPSEWRVSLGAQRPAAIFLTETISESHADTIVSELGEIDPNIPIVMLSDDGD